MPKTLLKKDMPLFRMSYFAVFLTLLSAFWAAPLFLPDNSFDADNHSDGNSHAETQSDEIQIQEH